MAVSLESFLDHAAGQNVALNSSFGELVTVNQMQYDEPDLLFAVSAAGICLREQPGSPLADTLITLNQGWTDDTPATVLCGLINASINPEPPPAPFHNFPLTQERVDSCAYADIVFSRILARLLFHGGGEMRPCLVYAEHGEPLILQKSRQYGAPSGLTLGEIWINSINYPAGSIVRVEYDGMEDELHPHSLLPRRLHVRPAHAITGMSFQRLSTYAIPPGERRTLFTEAGYNVGSFNATPAVRDLLEIASIKEVRESVKEAIGTSLT